MLNLLAAAGLTAVLAATGMQTDTTVTVRPGARLEVENFGGSIAITAWERNAVRVEATHSRRTRVEVEAEPSVVRIEASGRMGIPASVDYRIRVPRWMELHLSGLATDIHLEGTQGRVEAETVKGEVVMIGGNGELSLSSIEGEVRVLKTRGRLEASSVNRGVTVQGFSGDIAVETINGDVRLQAIESGSVEGSTVNGLIHYAGDVRRGGGYRFSTHNGDIWMELPVRVNADVAVSTFSGQFDASFPVQLEKTQRGRRFEFTLGSGGADIELESFQGRILLRRPGESPPVGVVAVPGTPAPRAVPVAPRTAKTPKPPKAPKAPKAPAEPVDPEDWRN